LNYDRTDSAFDHLAAGLMNGLIPGNTNNISLFVLDDVFGGFHVSSSGWKLLKKVSNVW
jgi:hypothetical protein